MKNLKTNTQPSARNLFTSCLCGLSSAVLASSFALFAPSASAAQLVDSNNDRYIEGVEKLEVAGTSYDVEFVFGTFDEVYKDGSEYDFTFDSISEVDQAFVALLDALAAVVASNPSLPPLGFLDPAASGDGVDSSIFVGYSKTQNARENWLSLQAPSLEGSVGAGAAREGVIAKFSESQKSTPEPSLILGFITLGGLILGSKRKTKG